MTNNTCARENCFAHSDGACRVLSKTYDGNEECCPFFKTARQFRADQSKYERKDDEDSAERG